MNENPVQGEFFTSASDLPERLVRESIQNSLDAARSNRDGEREVVRVRFAFSGNDHALAPEDAAPYLAGLSKHLDAVNLSPPSGSMPYLLVEDFGTTSLQGDIGANGGIEKGNDFWGFFRSVGISPKPEDSGGSWGLGKWVFPDASQLNAVVGVTLRQGESHALLMGQAALDTHSIEHDGQAIKYPPYGWFAESSGDFDHEWTPMPVQDSRIIDEAAKHFLLRREQEPGLSVIIPCPSPELGPQDIVRKVVTQYFYAIVSGALVVDVEHPDVPTVIVDDESIDDVVAGLGSSEREEENPDAMRKVVRLARTANAFDSSQLTRAMASERSDRLLEQLDLDELRLQFMKGLPVGFELATRVADKNGKRSEASFRMFVERDQDLKSGHDYFVRGNLQIPTMDHIQSYRARALVLVDGKSPLGHLLRDAEGPAHVKWDPHAKRLKERWSGGYARVQEVRRAAPIILQALV
ncbi:MAG: hypothetical protein F4Y69_05785, partial [Chloroflexi bacterium]|nr:hypothetical protein [Chloroflexota bacterium]